MRSALPILQSLERSESPSVFNRYPRSLMGSPAPPEIMSGESPEAAMLWTHSQFPRRAPPAGFNPIRDSGRGGGPRTSWPDQGGSAGGVVEGPGLVLHPRARRAVPLAL